MTQDSLLNEVLRDKIFTMKPEKSQEKDWALVKISCVLKVVFYVQHYYPHVSAQAGSSSSE